MVASVVRRPACSSGKQVTYVCPQHRKHVGLELWIAKLSSVVTVIILNIDSASELGNSPSLIPSASHPGSRRTIMWTSLSEGTFHPRVAHPVFFALHLV